MPKPLKITLIGNGRVAWQLGRRLRESGCEITQVLARDPKMAAALAQELAAQPITDFEQIQPGTDLFILAVSDGAISEIAEKLAKHQPGATVLHLSGATDRAAIGQFFGEKTAVLWPMHSFSFTEKPNWKKVPMVLETASDAQTVLFFEKFAKKIGPKIIRTSGSDRAKMHLAATFANNFTNHLMTLAENFLEKNGVDFPPLRMLFLETALKVQTQNPRDVQTGPANRNDVKTMEKHLGLLGNETGLTEIYQILSRSIQKSQISPEKTSVASPQSQIF